MSSPENWIHHNSRVVIYDCKIFIILATGRRDKLKLILEDTTFKKGGAGGGVN